MSFQMKKKDFFLIWKQNLEHLARQWMGRAHQGEISFLLIFLLSISSKENYNGKVITLEKVAQGFQPQQNTQPCHLLLKSRGL